MQPFASGGVYVNFLSDGEGEARIRAAYPGNYERLVDLKNQEDYWRDSGAMMTSKTISQL